MTIEQALADVSNDFKRKLAHVFYLYGNTESLLSNDGSRYNLVRMVATHFDQFIVHDLRGGPEKSESLADVARIVVEYVVPGGLHFLHPQGEKLWSKLFGGEASMPIDGMNPDKDVAALDHWFERIKELRRDSIIAAADHKPKPREMLVTLLIQDAHLVLKPPVWATGLRRWARDEQIGDRVRFILVTPSLESLPPDAYFELTKAYELTLPSAEERLLWLQKYDAKVRERTVKKPFIIVNREVRNIELAESYSIERLAEDSEGLSRKDMEDLIMASWVSGKAIGPDDVARARMAA